METPGAAFCGKTIDQLPDPSTKKKEGMAKIHGGCAKCLKKLKEVKNA